MSLQRKFNVDFPKVWKKLRTRFAKILTQTNFQTKGMEIQSDVYDLCNAKPNDFTQALYDELRSFFREFCIARREAILDQDDVLRAYEGHWLKYDLGSTLIDVACYYFNSQLAYKRIDHARPAAPAYTQTVKRMALQAWQDAIVVELRNNYGNRLMHQVFTAIEEDRQGNHANVESLYTVVRSLALLQSMCEGSVYRDHFEQPFLLLTRAFYARESALSIAIMPMSDYMRLVEQRLDREDQRCRRCMNADTIHKVIQECETQLVIAHKDRFYAECQRMIEERRMEDLARTYSLLSRTARGLEPMLDSFRETIVTVGERAVQLLGDSAAKRALARCGGARVPVIVQEPQLYVEKLLGIHSSYSEIVRAAFQRDAHFDENIDKAFRAIVNNTTVNPSAKAAELVSRYTDLLLRKGGRLGQTDRELEDRLSQTDASRGAQIVLFRYLDDKDIFQKHYARLLARRLIFGQSVSDGSEESMISKLKTACGVEYTSKLQRMFQDMALSQDLTAAFRSDSASASAEDLADVDVMVLTAGSWPVSQSTSLLTCPELAGALSAFEQFYHKRHQGRKLTWLHHLSRADVRVNYTSRRYDVHASAAQAAVLLQFNASTHWTCGDLQGATSISGPDFARVVKPRRGWPQSLIDVKLLTANDADLPVDAVISLNAAFSSKRTKLKINNASASETATEAQTTTKQVDVDRQMFLQALVVRIMKTRKVLTHTLLFEAILREARSRFAPSIPVIKKCIEDLIDKEYLERSGVNRDEYRYIA